MQRASVEWQRPADQYVQHNSHALQNPSKTITEKLYTYIKQMNKCTFRVERILL